MPTAVRRALVPLIVQRHLSHAGGYSGGRVRCQQHDRRVIASLPGVCRGYAVKSCGSRHVRQRTRCDATITSHDRGKIQARWHAQRLTRATGATVAVVLAAVGCTTTHPTAPTGAATATTTPTATAIATPTPAALTAAASVTHKHPIIGTKVGVLVSTTPNARITVVAHFPAENRERTARADATGLRTFWFQTATATPGYRVKVDVRVYAHGQKRFIRT